MRIRWIKDDTQPEWLPAWRVGDGEPPEWLQKALRLGWALHGPNGSILVYEDRHHYRVATPGSVVYLASPLPDHGVQLVQNELGCICMAWLIDVDGYWEVDDDT